MSEEVVERRVRPAGSGTARLALILAIVALVFSIMAYNRTGQNVDDRIKSEVQRSLNGAANTLNNGAQKLNQ